MWIATCSSLQSAKVPDYIGCIIIRTSGTCTIKGGCTTAPEVSNTHLPSRTGVHDVCNYIKTIAKPVSAGTCADVYVRPITLVAIIAGD